jgi:primosomal protein N'
MTPETETRPIPSEVTALAQTAPHFLEQVRVIESGEDMQLAMAELKQIKASLATFKPARDEFLRPAREALKAYEKRFDDAAAPIITKLNLAKSQWETGILTYNRAEQARAAEENRRREEEVQKQQAQMRAQAAAEAARAAAQAAEKRRKAEEAANAGKAAQAAKLASQADSIEAAAETKVAVLETTAASITAPSVEADVPKSEAGGFRKTYGAHVEDFEALVCAIAKGIESGSGFPSITLLKIDQANLNRQATALKEHMNIPGVKLDVKVGVVSR